MHERCSVLCLLTFYHHRFNGRFPGEPGLASAAVSSWKERLGIGRVGFLQAGCRSSHLANGVKALKETQSTDLNQEDEFDEYLEDVFL